MKLTSPASSTNRNNICSHRLFIHRYTSYCCLSWEDRHKYKQGSMKRQTISKCACLVPGSLVNPTRSVHPRELPFQWVQFVDKRKTSSAGRIVTHMFTPYVWPKNALILRKIAPMTVLILTKGKNAAIVNHVSCLQIIAISPERAINVKVLRASVILPCWADVMPLIINDTCIHYSSSKIIDRE